MIQFLWRFCFIESSELSLTNLIISRLALDIGKLLICFRMQRTSRSSKAHLRTPAVLKNTHRTVSFEAEKVNLEL